MLLRLQESDAGYVLPGNQQLDDVDGQLFVLWVKDDYLEGGLSQVYCYHKSNISPFYKALIICSLCIGFQFGTCDNNIIMQDFSA